MYSPIVLSNEADRLSELVKDLEEYKKEVVYGYVGEYDENGSKECIQYT
jgi:hypothetical protein